MFRITILYPAKEGTHFDMEYYLHKHMPMVQARLAPLGLKGVSAEKGINAGATGSPAPFHCMGHMLFESLEAYQAGMKAHGKELVTDIPKFTNSNPVIQVSEIVS